MRAVDLIEQKKRGAEHSPGQIKALIQGYQSGDVPDYQMAAWLMAVRWQGLTIAETVALTWAMAESGEQLDLSGLPRPWIDKHSTGGVGDKLTLIVVPLLVAAGVTVVKLSGRGLGHTGGTVDKLAAIPGLRLFMPAAELLSCARAAGGCLAGHSASLVPADGMVYALRDATATVDSLPLIAASIMSKKLACGADTIVFDVKVGGGGLLGDIDVAHSLAKMMLDIAARAGRRAVALLTSMEQPLGRAVGNALEVNEAVDVLRGGGDGGGGGGGDGAGCGGGLSDLRGLSVALAGEALFAAGVAPSAGEGAVRAEALLDRGLGLQAFERIVVAQGGDIAAVLRPGGLALSRHARVLAAPAEGVLAFVEARAVGMASVLLGAGRGRKGEDVDPGAGIMLHVRSGDMVAKGQPLATVYASDEARLEAGLGQLEQAFVWGHADGGDRRLGTVPGTLVLETLRSG